MSVREVVARARRLAAEQTFDAVEVGRWLREGSDEQRITALGMMQAKPELRDFDAMLAAIEDSRSAFEQYHAMLLALKMIDDLSATQQNQLTDAVRSVRGLRFRRDTDRWGLSEEILLRAR